MIEQRLFEVDDLPKFWEEEWQGMPEFVMDNLEAHQKIIVSFKCREDVEEFSKLIGQSLTSSTNSIWFPRQENYVAPKNFLYIDES